MLAKYKMIIQVTITTKIENCQRGTETVSLYETLSLELAIPKDFAKTSKKI